MNMKFFFLPILFELLLVSCTSPQQTRYADVEKVFPTIKKQPPKMEPRINPPVSQPMDSPFDHRWQDTRRPLKPKGGVNVSVHEVDAREFFMGLVVDTDDNMLVHPDVKGRLSLELKNVTIPQVLDAVQKVYGYDYKKTDIGYIIYPATLQTKTFKIDRLDLLREGKSNTYVSSGQTGNSSSGYGNQQSQNNNQSVNNNPINTNIPVTRSSGSSITTTTQTDFWKELEEALRTLISVDKEATVVINRQSGVVIARAKYWK
jgi:MSHA biogenesis protein MshL